VNRGNIQCNENAPLMRRKRDLLAPALKEGEERRKIEDSAAALYGQARMYREKNMAAEEEASYRRCLDADPKYARCHYGLFLVYKEDGRSREARAACRTFLKYSVDTGLEREIDRCERYVSGDD
jgi:hypothetical protein